MKYIGKISSVLLTVAFVVAFVFANNNKNEIRGSKTSSVQRFQEKNQAGFVKKNRESIVVVYDKEEEIAEQETNKPTETEITPQGGSQEVIPINDVIHSSKLIERGKTNAVYTKSTSIGEPEKDLTKEEITALVQQHKNNPTAPITQREKDIISSYLDDENNQNESSVDRTASHSAPSVVINEIMYNPAMPLDASGAPDYNDDREFIELHNTTASAIDLSGWYYSQGVVDTFPSGTSIAAYGYLVSGKDTAAYFAKYGEYPDVCCWDSGSLGNSGEDVVLKNASGATIDSVDFEDGYSSSEQTNGWLPSTDGAGPSLERMHPNLNGAASTNLAWAAYAGTDSAGTPGARNSTHKHLLVEGFEDATFPPSGWQTISLNTGNSVTQSSGYSHSGSKALRFSSYSSSGGGDYTQYLISPKLSVQSGDSLALWYKKSSTWYTDNVYVGISTTDSSIASFTFGDALSISTTYARHAQELLSSAKYVALKYYGNYAGHLYVDDITGPAVYHPSTAAASLSTSSLAFGKVVVGDSSATTVSLSNVGAADLVYTVASDNANFTVSATGGTLAPQLGQTWVGSEELTVTYSPSVDGAVSANLVFTHNGPSSPDTVGLTGQGSYSILVEGFEGGAWTGSPGAPTGWSQLAVVAATSSYPTAPWSRYGPYTPGSGVYAGNYSARTAYAYPGHEHVLISPALELSSSTNAPLGYQLEFMIKGYSYSGLDVYVEIDTASATAGGSPDFTGTDTLFTFIGGSSTFTSTWYANEARLGSYSGTYHIGFRVDDANGYYAYLDDIEVAVIPPQPTADLDANSFKLIPQLIGDSVTTLLTIGSNTGGGNLVVSSITSSNPEMVVALTTMATGDTVVPNGSIDLDVTWEPTAFGMKSSTVIVTHNAASSPDTLTFMGEAGRQYVDFDDREFPYGWGNLDLDPPGTYETDYYGYQEGQGWSMYWSYPPGYGGYGDAYARSHYSLDGANDWLITEKVVPVAGDSMIFYSNSSASGSWDPADLEDTLFVYASTSNEVGLDTSGNTVGALLDNATLLDTVVSQGYTNIRSAYSLAQWVDDTVFLVIHHKGSAGTNQGSYRKVDDFILPQKWVDQNAVLAGLPGAVNFDAVFPGDSSTGTGSLFNAGIADLVISSVVSDNPAFSVTPATATVSTDSSLLMSGVYAPTVSGADTAHLIITSNSASSPDTVLLTGSAFETSGGPDLAGNTWASSRNANGTAFAWIDTSGAYDTGALTGDDTYGVIDLPFPVRFYGLPYTEITASSNGLIGMGQIVAASDYSNDPIPNTYTPNNYIAPMWDDFSLGTGPYSWSNPPPGAIYTKTVGTEPNRKFAVTFWDMVRSFSDGTDYYSWQVVFDEATGNVVVQYLDLLGSGLSANYGGGATVGIENSDGTDGLQVSYNGSYTLEDSSTITFIAGPAVETGIEGVVVSTDDSQVGGVGVWANGTLLTETGQNSLFEVPGFETDSTLVGSFLAPSRPWWVFPETLTNYYHASAGDLIWNDSLGGLGTNVFMPAAGTRALKMYGQFIPEENYTTIYQEYTAPEAGTEVHVGAWAMHAEDNKLTGGNGFFVSIIWLTPTHGWIYQTQSDWITADDETDEWHYVDAHSVAPEGAGIMQVTVSYYQDAVYSSGSIYIDETRSSLNPGHYAYYGAPEGNYSVEFAKEGFNSSFYTTTIALNDTVELNAMITPEALVDYHSGFEVDDDPGGSHADNANGLLFGVLDSLHLVLTDSVGVDTTGATVYDTTEFEVDPYMGDGMLVYPGTGRDVYENDAVVMWIAGETFDASSYVDGGGYVNLSWRANFETEEDFDFFYVGLMLEDSSVIWDEENGSLTGESTGWGYFATDVTWVSALVGAETVTPVVMFVSDGSVVDGWGGAFDELDVSGNPYFLAGPGRLEVGSFDSNVPVHWEEPASAGRATYNLRRFNIGDMDNLRRPSAQVNGTSLVLSKGQREFESLQIEVDYDNSSSPRDVLAYTLHRRAWTGGMIGEWEALAGDLVSNQYYDFNVEEGSYYDYRVSLMYDEGPADWESNEAQAHVGVPNVILMDSLQMEDFYPDLGGWAVHTTDSTVTWVTGDSAYYDSLNSTTYYGPPDFDSSFAFVVGPGLNGAGTVVLISPFMDWSWHASGLVGVDAWHRTPSSWYDFYGSAKLMVRSQMGEWHEVVDVSYSHTDPETYDDVFHPELVDVSQMVGHNDRVQFAFVYHYPDYNSGAYSGLAIDNFELHLVDGPDNLTYASTTETVSLFWEASDGRRANEYPYLVTQEDKEAYLLLQNGSSKTITGAQTLGRSTDGSGDIRNNAREMGDNMTDPFVFELDEDTLFMGSTVGFTHDYSGSCGYDAGAPDVVYLMHLPDSVNGVIFDLCESGTSYDTRLYVYSALDTVNDIACNDDWCTSASGSSLNSYIEIGSTLPEEGGGVSAGDYYIVVDGYSTGAGDYTLEVSVMEPPAEMMYNVWKDGNLAAGELPDTVLTYTDTNVSLLESEYTVNASRLMNLSIPLAVGLEPGHVQTEHTNSVFASKVNMEPGAFNLVTPPDGESLVITEDNIGGNQIFAWSQSVDPNGSEITYHITWQTETDTGTFEIWDDTTGTAILIPIQLMANIMTGYAALTGDYIADFAWTVYADDGYDQVEATNGPLTLTVDVGWYLGIDDVAAIPGVFALHQNYPNPFNPVTTIRYDVPEQSHVTMEIYNLLGQRVTTLVSGIQEPGYHAILWNGTNMNGAAMSSGMYFYHIQAGDFRAVKKLILVK